MNNFCSRYFTLFILLFFLSCNKDEYFPLENYFVTKLADSTNLRPFDSAGELIFNDSLWLFGGWTPNRASSVYNSNNGVDWYFINDAPWPKRNLTEVVSFKGKIFIIGGYGNAGLLNDVWSSVDGRNWTLEVQNAPFGKRCSFGLVEFKKQLILIGGIGEGGLHYNDIWVSDNGVDWRCLVSKSKWEERGAFGCVVFKNKIFLIGGGIYDENYVWNVKKNFNDVWESSDGVNWQLVNRSCPFPARRFLSSTVFKDKILIFGGYSLQKGIFNSPIDGILKSSLTQDSLIFYSWEKSRFGNLNDVWLSNDGKIWSELIIESPKIPIRHESSIFTTSDKVFIIGGFGETLFNDVWTIK